MPFEVFISYSSVDANAAEAVRAGLENAGIGCWFAPRDALPGDRYQGSIVRAIRQSRAVVFLLSRNSNGSAHVFRELHTASEARKPIVPVRLDDVQPGDDMYYYLGPLHWLDAQRPPLSQHIARLIEVLAPHVTDAPAGAAVASDVMRANGTTRVRPAVPVPPPAARAPAAGRAGILRRRTWGVAAGAVVVVVSAFSATKWGFTQDSPRLEGVMESGTQPGQVLGVGDTSSQAGPAAPAGAQANRGNQSVDTGGRGSEPTPTTPSGTSREGARQQELPQIGGGVPRSVVMQDSAARATAARLSARTPLTAERSPDAGERSAVPPPPPAPISPEREDSIAEAVAARHRSLLGSALRVLTQSPPASSAELDRARADARTVYLSDAAVNENKATAAYIIGSVARLQGNLDECVRWLGYAVQLRPGNTTFEEGMRRCQAGD